MEINESIKDLFEPELMEEILAVGKKKTAKEGEVIISIGQRLLFMPIVLQGTVKVSMMQPDGRELLMADIDMARSEDVRRIWPFLRDRRIDAYDDLLKRFRD